MTRKRPPRRDNDRPAGVRRRLVALLAVLVLCLPAYEGRAAASDGHAVAAHLSLDLPVLDWDEDGPGGHADGGIAHHCTQCACHQALTATAETSPTLRPPAEIRFTEWAGPDRARTRASPQATPRLIVRRRSAERSTSARAAVAARARAGAPGRRTTRRPAMEAASAASRG
ncbi:hypothetical protein [Methylobacterium nigriterrae]|uniref:hypothetical protein n=1 Tax=Methylobacterium nigriterrae TaxID=3127512 RepID=UPI0030141851